MHVVATTARTATSSRLLDLVISRFIVSPTLRFVPVFGRRRYLNKAGPGIRADNGNRHYPPLGWAAFSYRPSLTYPGGFCKMLTGSVMGGYVIR